MIRTANGITGMEGTINELIEDYGNITGALYQQMKGSFGKTGAKEKLLNVVKEKIEVEKKEPSQNA